jgi:Cu(I)/Ag(I) efflux system membrane fusion protein
MQLVPKCPDSQGAAPTASETTALAESKPQYWYDPMHPAEHFDKAGKSPFMDMQLVPKYSKDAAPGSITVDSRVVQNLGLRLAKVEQGSFARLVDTVGSVGVDEHRIEAVQVRQPGWVERLDVRAVGD